MPDKLEVSIDVILHATENSSKFYQIFEELFDIKPDEFSVQNLVGHFDNPITLLSAKFTKKKALEFVEKLFLKISKNQVDQIIEEIPDRVENSTLHLRFDKQKFVQGRIENGEKNAIKIKIFTPIYNKKETKKIFGKILQFSN